MSPERYFILVYDVRSRAVEIREFDHSYAVAADAYSEMEQAHRDDEHIEVVLLGADSIETIHKTHSHYFVERTDELFRQFLEGATSNLRS